MSAVYIAITSHGFGHAVRACSVAGAVQQLNPDILLILATTAPRWLLESYIAGDFIHRPRAFDVGVIQTDSLTMDKAATFEKLQHIRARQNAIIASEANFLRTNRVGLVLADIPPLAAPIASAAGVPCWMMSNFGWDFIYRDWGEAFAEIADWMGDCYGKCDRLFRLPLHEPMSAFPTVTDVGLTGGTPRFSEIELRQTFQLRSLPQKTALLTFGGLGLQQIPYRNVANFPDWQFVTFDRQAPDLDNLVKVSDLQYRPVDFMPLCGRVVSKPGYSTFAEALKLKVPVVSIQREGFAEAPILIEGLQNYGEHQILAAEELFEGNWEFLNQPLHPPRNSTALPIDGTEAIAREIVGYLHAGKDGKF